MNKGDVVSLFNQAKETVEGLPESLQAVAFPLAIRLLSEDLKPTDKTIVGTPQGRQDRPIEPFFVNMAKNTGFSEDNLKVVYELKESGKLEVKIAPERLRLVYLFLLGVQLGKGDVWTSSRALGGELNRHGLGDPNLNKKIARETAYIRFGGKGASREYSLTPRGLDKAKQNLKEILGE